MGAGDQPSLFYLLLGFWNAAFILDFDFRFIVLFFILKTLSFHLFFWI